MFRVKFTKSRPAQRRGAELRQDYSSLIDFDLAAAEYFFESFSFSLFFVGTVVFMQVLNMYSSIVYLFFL